ncbi:hypothetical protein GCM10025883_16820 [Mobilicoccus caccae]|uniref:Uncharacterized protein n=1 Tax=Mobilicoccus caccae TaxID=1859295 RepID=A0ABQ6ISD5_9MICO|nr:hypothetical protein GCM10025883_16820 [Mobilicoccus caccae]
MHPAPDARRVDEPPGLATEFDELVHRIAGRAGEVVDDDPLLPGQLVEHARLAHVGTAHESHPARPATRVGTGDRRLLGQHGQHGVEHVAAAPPVQGRDRVGLTEPEGPQHRRVRLGAAVVDLVGHEDHGLTGPAQQLDDGLVGVGRTDHGVDDEHDHVGQFDGHLGLFGDAQVDARGVDLPPAGVDQGEPATGPLGVVGHPVARDAGNVLDDRLAAPEDAVDQRRLADVRAPDDRHDGPVGVVLVVDLAGAALKQGQVLLVELELLEAGAQHPLDRPVVLTVDVGDDDLGLVV